MNTVRFVAVIPKELYDKIMIQCRDEFFEHHPELKGIRITRQFMLEKLSTFYLEQ